MSNGSPDAPSERGTSEVERGTSEVERGTSTAPIHSVDPTTARAHELDARETTSWAIGSVISGGIIVGYSAFDLVNRETGRAHSLHIPTGGLTTDLGVAGGGLPTYTMFETRRAVSFRDFRGLGARITSANVAVLYGYSITYLTLWDGAAYFSPELAYVRMGGWGAMIPGGSVAHGVTALTFGSGSPLGSLSGVPLILVPEADDYVPEPALVYIRMA